MESTALEALVLEIKQMAEDALDAAQAAQGAISRQTVNYGGSRQTVNTATGQTLITQSYTGVQFYWLNPVVTVATDAPTGSHTTASATYDASASVPAGAVAVIVDALCYADNTDLEVQCRQSSATPWLYVCRARNAAVDDDASTGQAIIPITSDRKFDYQAIYTAIGGNHDGYFELRIVGYLK